ncbi:MAG TPA: cysteine--tRNA ligase [Nevskiales bacterium]|nr:cysteine--tRNA ligase [Nevskiales bacterium]
MITIHNSLSGRKEPLQPIADRKVRLYVCGITVYDYCHLGHARFMVVFDAVVRHLRARGYDVTYVRNITDIDDKIINRAREQGIDWRALTQKFIAAMDEDCAALGLLKPDLEPRATEHIPQIIAMIEKLVARGLAYQASNKDVYYDVSKFEGYGKLSGKQLEDLRVGARVAVDEAKDDALDFVLWKAAKPGEPAWDSPWGPGRPGWHIECSAMSTHCLGNHFDIHGGGMDLKFPHHENEIAQSEGATGETFVNLWMHNGFVQVNAEKMSKSLGNFATLRDLLKVYRAEEIRYFILGSHYRSPLDFSDEHLKASNQGLNRLYTALRGLPVAPPPADEPYTARFDAAMDDDFNTPVAISVLFELARDINVHRGSEPQQAASLGAVLRRLGGRLGLLQQDPQAWFTAAQAGGPDAAEIERLIAARLAARKAKNFTEADRIRDELLKQGVRLEDKPGGTLWSRVG